MPRKKDRPENHLGPEAQREKDQIPPEISNPLTESATTNRTASLFHKESTLPGNKSLRRNRRKAA